MIIGIGADIVSVDRVAAALDRFGDRFLARVYTGRERRAGLGRGDPARFFALRFAAKEAAWKALSPERGQGVGWHDFEVVGGGGGKPGLVLGGTAGELLAGRAGTGGRAELSLSDDGGFALAFVVLSAP